jgi:T4 superinfection immunity protein
VTALSFFGMLLLLIFYFLPAVIASQRHTKHGGMIFLINFVFGWTILGWIAALIWAIVEAPQDQKPQEHALPNAIDHSRSESGRLISKEEEAKMAEPLSK